MMKSKGLFEWQGGPNILSQIKNEFGPLEYNGGAPARAYANWVAKMAASCNMHWCSLGHVQRSDAPDPVINTCNGFYCDYFSPNKPYNPNMWIEAWTGWFTAFGGPVPHRPDEAWPSLLQDLFKKVDLLLTTTCIWFWRKVTMSRSELSLCQASPHSNP